MLTYTLVDVQNRLRIELADSLRPYTWSDERLMVLIVAAMQRVGRDAPRPVRLATTFDDGQSLSLPDDAVRVVALEMPPGTYIARGDSYHNNAPGQCWQVVDGQTLRLRRPVAPGTNVAVQYLAGFAPTGDPLTPVIPDPDYYEGIVVAACLYAEERLTNQPAGSGQAAGLRSDSRRYAGLYAAWLRAKRRQQGIVVSSLVEM